MKVRIRGQEHSVDVGSLTFGEGVNIEDWTGWTFTEFSEKLGKGSMKAFRAFALVLVQKTDPTARMADIDKMGMDELEFIPEDKDAAPPAADVVKWEPPDPTPAASEPPVTES